MNGGGGVQALWDMAKHCTEEGVAWGILATLPCQGLNLLGNGLYRGVCEGGHVCRWGGVQPVTCVCQGGHRQIQRVCNDSLCRDMYSNTREAGGTVSARVDVV